MSAPTLRGGLGETGLGSALPPWDDLPTPALVIDVARLERNLDDAAAAYAAAGLSLRPHVKTSKCLEVIGRQRDRGAMGFTCSTPAEVELLARNGFRGLLWAHQPVGPTKVDFAVHAAHRLDTTLIVDSVEVAGPLSTALAVAGVQAQVLLEVDTGQARTGVVPDEAREVADAVDALPGITLRGVLTHEGHLAAHGPDRAGLEASAAQVGSSLAAVARELERAGHDMSVVSVGSTPGMTVAPFAEGVTEARPGTYVYMDANQFRLGSTPADRWALTVVGRVVSTRHVARDETVVIDAGLKAMSSDTLTPQTGAGLLVEPSTGDLLPGLSFPTANEEHGFVAGRAASGLHVGELVRVVPNHACGTANMWSRAFAVFPDGHHEIWQVLARH